MSGWRSCRNRIDAEQQAKLLTDIFGKIPMVTPEEQRDWQISNLEADARVWSTLSEMESGLATGAITALR